LIVKVSFCRSGQPAIEASGVDSHNNDVERRCIGAREADGKISPLYKKFHRRYIPTRKPPLMDGLNITPTKRRRGDGGKCRNASSVEAGQKAVAKLAKQISL
jgi:hypothetical protein